MSADGSVTEYRAEVIVRSANKSATSAKRPLHSHLTPVNTFEPQVHFDVGRTKAQMRKVGMEVVEVRYLSRIALPWQLIKSEKSEEVENG